MNISEAFRSAPRGNFLPPRIKHLSERDFAIAIGHSQTTSQPTTVWMMLEWLDVRPGDKVLDVGTGSGWTAALLANLVSLKGKVTSVERIPELITFARANIKRLGLKNITIRRAGKQFGCPEESPYDRILVSASASTMPDELVAQLKLGGRMVIPIGESIWVVDKDKKDVIATKEHPGFLFVPLV